MIVICKKEVPCCAPKSHDEQNVDKRQRKEKLLIREFHDLYSSPIIILIFKARKIGWAGHLAAWENYEVHINF